LAFEELMPKTQVLLVAKARRSLVGRDC